MSTSFVAIVHLLCLSCVWVFFLLLCVFGVLGWCIRRTGHCLVLVQEQVMLLVAVVKSGPHSIAPECCLWCVG